MTKNDEFYPEEPTEVSRPPLTPLPDFGAEVESPAVPAPQPYYGILITFGMTNTPESGRIVSLPKHVHSLPALAWHTLRSIWRHRNLLRGRP